MALCRWVQSSGRESLKLRLLRTAALKCTHEHSHTTCLSHKPFLGAFAKLRKETIIFIMSVCLYVRPSVRMEQLGFHWTDLRKIWYLSILRKSVQKIQVPLQSDKNNRYLHEDISEHISQNFLRMRNISLQSCREKQNTHFTFNIFFFENLTVYEIIWKI